MGLIEDIFYEDSVTFLWKNETENFTEICLRTFGLYIKGGSYEYYLITFDNSYDKIEHLLVAGYWSISVENPYGGTSAGEKWHDAVIDSTGLYMSLDNESESGEYHLEPNGEFLILYDESQLKDH